MKIKEKILPSAAAAAFFVLTLFVFAPGHLFLTNAREFNTTFFELLGHLFIIALPLFFLVTMLVLILPQKRNVHKKTAALLLALAVLLWLQGNILVWNYGLLTGGRLQFNIYFLIADSIVWLAVLMIVFRKYEFFYKHAVILSCAFLGVQLVFISFLVYSQPVTAASKQYEIDTAVEFTFSRERNVMILVLDSLQSDVFQKIIDEDESCKDIFEGFTYFPDSVAGFPTTFASIPNILTGHYYDNSMPFSKFLEQAYLSAGSIPKVLKDNGYEVHCFPYLDNIYIDERAITNTKVRTGIERSVITGTIDAAFFRYSPDVFKGYIYNDGEWLLKNTVYEKQPAFSHAATSGESAGLPAAVFDEKALTLSDVAFINRLLMNANTAEEKNVFKFYRLHGAHVPYLLNEDLRYERMGTDGYERQAKASLKIAGIFLDELKRLDVFDNSLIFVIADHGIPADEVNMRKNAHPLFLVKKFNGTGQMIRSDAPVSLSDIPDTVFSELGLLGNMNGKSIFNINESGSRERRFLFYVWKVGVVWDDYLPTTKEFLVSGPVWLSESWRYTGRKFIPDFIEGPFLEWEGGFFALEGIKENTWRWCSSEGILIINNTSDKNKKLKLSARLCTGYKEMSDLRIESGLFSADLKINNTGYNFNEELLVPPGSHAIKFTCNAPRVDAPGDTRHLVFLISKFQAIEIR